MVPASKQVIRTHHRQQGKRASAMHANAKLIETFYTAFKNSDPAGMNACYHQDFPALHA